jgi:antitoxin component of MazEF toxin-antitoxin module
VSEQIFKEFENKNKIKEEANMKIFRFFLGSLIVMIGFSVFISCSFENEPSTPSTGYRKDIIDKPVCWNPAVPQQLIQQVNANGGEEVVLDLTNEGIENYVYQRLALSEKTRANSMQLFKEIEKTKQRQLAKKSRGEALTEVVPAGDGHLVIKLAQDEDGSIVASAEGSVKKLLGYFFLDVVGFDGTEKYRTEYTSNEIFDDPVLNHNGIEEDDIGKSFSCTAKGTTAVFSRGDTAKGINADTLMMYMTKDSDGDGIDDLAEAGLKISYAYSGIILGNTIYPTALFLEHPTEKISGGDDFTTCTICLNRSNDDCDYDVAKLDALYGNGGSVYNAWGDILMPFKGKITYKGYKIVMDNPSGGTKPDPNATDEDGNIIRNIDLALCLEDAGGISKRQTPEATNFFWNHPKTIASYDWQTDTSTLSWDLLVDFGNKVFVNSDRPKFFVTISVPVLKSDPIPFKATAFIIPENHFDGTPYKYNPFLNESNCAPGPHTLMAIGSGTGTGTNQLEVNATTYSWTVDTTPPEAVLINKPLQFTKNKKASITVGGTDVVAYSYKLDVSIDNTNYVDNWSSVKDIKEPIVKDVTGTPFNNSILCRLYVVGIDRAGNRQEEKTTPDCTWLITPSTAAEASLSNLPPYFSNSADINIKVEGESLTTYDYQLDTNNKVTGRSISQNITATGLSEGEHTLKVWGNGAAQTSPTCYTWVIDRTPPTATLYMPKTADFKSSVTSFTAEVGGTGVCEYEYCIDGNPLQKQSVSTLITATGLAPGVHTLYVYPFDRAGNRQATAKTYQWQIDTALKYIAFSNLPRAFSNIQNLNIELKGDAVQSYKYQLDAGGWSVEIPLEDLMTMPKMRFIWSCVAADSQITMADGSTKAIKDVNKGEWVMSANNTKYPVEMITTGKEPIAMYRITDIYSHSLLLTHGHPVVMADDSLKLARDLRVGDIIKSNYGPAKLVRITTEMYDGTIYNLTLGTEEQIAQNNKEGFTMYANNILIGDNNMQTRQMNLAFKLDGNLLARLPSKWHADYLNSPILR